jgi:hypothetical protein
MPIHVIANGVATKRLHVRDNSPWIKHILKEVVWL